MAFLDHKGRCELVSIARSFLDTPFIHQARVPGWHGGLDCGGLIVCTANLDGDAHMVDETNYSNQPWARRLKAHCQRTMNELSGLEAAQRGSVVLFWIRGRRKIPHSSIDSRVL